MSEKCTYVALRLFGIGLVVPICVHLVAALLWAPILIFTSMVSYPLMVSVTLLLLLPTHLLFKKYIPSMVHQLAAVTSAGAGFGFLVYLLLFVPFTPGRFSASLATDYTALGLLSSTFCWVFYHWGPFRVSSSGEA
jgi:hypothetical protein